jgi:hypothetical protein
MFSPGQAGSLNGQLEFALDAYSPADGGWWLLTLDRTTMVVTLTYNDSDLGGTGTAAWAWTPSQCTVLHFQSAGRMGREAQS